MKSPFSFPMDALTAASPTWGDLNAQHRGLAYMLFSMGIRAIEAEDYEMVDRRSAELAQLLGLTERMVKDQVILAWEER